MSLKTVFHFSITLIAFSLLIALKSLAADPQLVDSGVNKARLEQAIANKRLGTDGSPSKKTPFVLNFSFTRTNPSEANPSVGEGNLKSNSAEPIVEEILMPLEPVTSELLTGTVEIVKADGTHVLQDPITVDLFRGSVVTDAGSVDESAEFVSLVSHGEGAARRTIGLTSLDGKPVTLISTENEQSLLSFQVKEEEQTEENYRCGVEDSFAPAISSFTDGSSGSEGSSNDFGTQPLRVIEVALVYDCLAIQHFGGIADTQLAAAAIVNAANHAYEFQARTTLRIVHQRFYESCATDPFQNPNYTSPYDLYNEMQVEAVDIQANAVTYDLAHLIHGHEFSNTAIVGLGENGGLCHGGSRGGVGITFGAWSLPLASNVFAHEIGHNLGAGHLSGCDFNRPETLFIMCPSAGMPPLFKQSSLNVFESELSGSCVSEEVLPGAYSTPYFDPSTLPHSLVSLFANGHSYYQTHARVYEGLNFSSQIPVADPNGDSLILASNDLPPYLSINSAQQLFAASVPRNCSVPDYSNSFAEFNVSATDPDSNVAIHTFSAGIWRHPFLQFSLHPFYAYPGQPYDRLVVPGSFPDLTFQHYASYTPAGASVSDAPPGVHWDPLPSEYGESFSPIFSTQICGEYFSHSDEIIALPGVGIPVFKKPALPVRVIEGERLDIPYFWVADEFNSYYPLLFIPGGLPNTSTFRFEGTYGVDQQLVVEPDENEVTPCFGAPEGERNLERTYTLTIESRLSAGWTYLSETQLDITIVDNTPPPLLSLSFPQFNSANNSYTMTFSSRVPNDGVSELVLRTNATNTVNFDTVNQRIVWERDFTGIPVVNNQQEVYFELAIASCGGDAKVLRRTIVNYVSGGGSTPTPSPTPFPTPTPGATPTPSSSPTPSPSSSATPTPEASPTPTIGDSSLARETFQAIVRQIENIQKKGGGYKELAATILNTLKLALQDYQQEVSIDSQGSFKGRAKKLKRQLARLKKAPKSKVNRLKKGAIKQGTLLV
ncbi:MAG: hypothetical protein KDD70_08860, partial [Bdellovibrionales bacterium]|nr:hypothetical protein [Bdellovibrionales bacterium]